MADWWLVVCGQPVMIYSPGKIAAFSRKCLERKLATVVVGFPATPLLLARCRVCVSAAHTQEDLDRAVEVWPLLNLLTNLYPSGGLSS
jgi:serine palmitoyltransferase